MPDTEALTAWTAAIMAACASGVELYVLATVDAKTPPC